MGWGSDFVLLTSGRVGGVRLVSGYRTAEAFPVSPWHGRAMGEEKKVWGQPIRELLTEVNDGHSWARKANTCMYGRGCSSSCEEAVVFFWGGGQPQPSSWWVDM